MSEEKKIASGKINWIAIGILISLTVLAISFSIYATVKRAQAEHRADLIERIKTLELDSCNTRNNDLTQHLQEVLYTLEYEKRKNQPK